MSALFVILLCLANLGSVHSFATPSRTSSMHVLHSDSASTISSPSQATQTLPRRQQTVLSATNDDDGEDKESAVISAINNEDKEDKFSFFQRIESIKTAVLGLLSGGFAAAPFTALHDLPTYGAAQWEFDTDMGSLQSALFAIVYRYCIREEDDNDMLNMGVVGAFVVTRTLSRIRLPYYCTAAPLDCGDPLGYFDWDMLQQLALNGLESVALFGGAALAMEVAYDKKWISKFPN